MAEFYRLCFTVFLIVSQLFSGCWAWRSFWWMRQRDQAEEIKPVKCYDYLIRQDTDNSQYGPNVCSFEVVPRRSMMADVFWERVLGVRLYGRRTLLACCPGFTSEQNKKGCPKEMYTSSENLIQRAKSSDLRSLVTSITDAGLGDALLGEGPLTLFAPTNEAFQRYQETSQFRVDGGDQQALKNLLLNHVVSGKIVKEELYEGKELKTLAGNILKISKTWSGEGRAVEGSNILPEYNLGASNGIIHTIDRVITTPSQSVKEFLETRPEFSRFRAYLQAAGLKYKPPVTVFVFSDKAIEDLEADFLQQPCDGIKKMIQNHILNGGHYLSAFSPRSAGSTILGQSLRIRRENSTYTVNDAEVTVPDIPVTDGVIHVLDKPIIPLKARDVINAAARFDFASEFLAALKKVDGEKDTLRTGNWTVFIPTNTAFSKIPDHVTKKMEDTGYLSKVLLYHVVPGFVYPQDLKNDNLLSTQSSPSKLRTNVYRRGSVLAVNGVQLSKYSGVCNGVVYFIDQVLIPPEQSVLDILKENQNLTILFQLLQSSGLAGSLSAPLTLFAPTNKALEGLGLTQDELDDPPEEVVEVLKYHVVPRAVYASAFSSHKCTTYYQSFFRSRLVQTLQGKPLRLAATGSGHRIDTFQVNGVEVAQRNVQATDGVVQIIDKVLSVPTSNQILRLKFSYL